MKRFCSRGFGIAELMVAMALGLVVTLLAFTLLLAASTGHVRLSEAAAVDDAGRYALAVIERAARQSGLHDWNSGAAPDGAGFAAVAGLDAASLSSDTSVLDSPRPAAVNGSDVLALRFAGAGDGSVTNCAGFAVPGNSDGWSIFYVGLNGRRDPELRCKYLGTGRWSADAVVAGVDSFQVLYGLDTDAEPDGVPNRYVPASEIAALDGALVPEGGDAAERARDKRRKSHWKRVVTVKLALMLHGARPTAAAGPSLYQLFGSAYGGSSGRDTGTRIARNELAEPVRSRERRVFTSTILLRNRVAP